MKLSKKLSIILVLLLAIFVPAIYVSANSETRAAPRYCYNCEELTPFVDCTACSPKNPYHCNVCGFTYTESLCPSRY